MTTLYAVKISAKNTPSGNPNRGWLVFGPGGEYLGFVDEGYRGRRGNLPDNVIVLTECDVPSSAVNDARRDQDRSYDKRWQNWEPAGR